MSIVEYYCCKSENTWTRGRVWSCSGNE